MAMIMRPTNKGLIDLIRFLPEECIMIEIGSYQGESTQIFLESNKIQKIFCVDPWANGYDNKDAASKRFPMKDVEKIFDTRFNNDDRVIKIKETSQNALNILKNIFVDFVYIDGLHTYEGVKFDIENYKLKCNIIGGHDYCMQWTSVKNAVLDCVGVPDHVFEDGSWIKFLNK